MTAYLFKYDLARAYFPDVSPAVASRLLSREIHRNSPLMEALATADYHPTQKRLTPRQVQIIYSFLGEP